MPAIEIPRKFEKVLTAPQRIIVLLGGRSSAKSESVGRELIKRAQTEQADVLCGREFQTSIADSVHKLIGGLVKKLDVQGAEVLDNKIRFAEGGGFVYKGFARNSDAVKSAQDFKYSWIEEAQSLSQQSIDDLLPTIRAANSKLFFTANPQASNDPFSKRFITPFKRDLNNKGFYEDEMHLIIMMNWRDNPWHKELEQQRLWDFEHMTRAKYMHIWEGEFNDEVEDSIIKAEWFDACIDAHLKLGFKPTGFKICSHDPSDLGPDPKGLVIRHGSVITHVEERVHGDVNDGCDWATTVAADNDCDMFIWDCDGLGVTLRRQVAESLNGKNMQMAMFKGSESPVNPKAIYQPDPKLDQRQAKTNKETFRNKRAQYSWRFRDRCFNTYLAVEKGKYVDPDEMISISSDIGCMDQFRSEVCRIPRKHNPNGYIQIMTKKEMKQLKIESPNLFDSAMMAMEIPVPVHVETAEDLYIPDLVRF